jgi:threonine/homoserine/homoserine lactone efflux protein
VTQAILVNLLNPKLTVFFFAFLPQFVPAGTTDALPLLLQASAVFMAMTLAVFAVYGVLSAAVREHVLARPSVMTWLRRAFALAFVGLGARLAFAER